MARKSNFGVMAAGGGDQSKRSDNDYYGTPPEPTIAMLQHYIDVLPRVLADLSCGAGHLVRPMVDMGFTVLASDLYHRGFGYGAIDFLKLPAAPAWRKIGLIMNPPFNRADEMIEHAHRLGFPFIAMYLKQTYWNAAKRYALWEKYPPKACHPLGWRVDFNGGGAPTMDCAWNIWSDDIPFSNEPFQRPK